MIKRELAEGCRAIGKGVAHACALFFQPRLEPVGAELEGVLRLDAIGVAGEVCNKGVKRGHGSEDKNKSRVESVQPGQVLCSPQARCQFK